MTSKHAVEVNCVSEDYTTHMRIIWQENRTTSPELRENELRNISSDFDAILRSIGTFA